MVTMSDSFAINKIFEVPQVVIPRAPLWSLDVAFYRHFNLVKKVLTT